MPDQVRLLIVNPPRAAHKLKPPALLLFPALNNHARHRAWLDMQNEHTQAHQTPAPGSNFQNHKSG